MGSSVAQSCVAASSPSCFLDSSAPSFTLGLQSFSLAVCVHLICSCFGFPGGRRVFFRRFLLVIGIPNVSFQLPASHPLLIMSCGNGCGCCPKCGCRATCTCNQSMYFNEDAVDKVSFSCTNVIGNNNSDCPDDGEPWATGVNDIGYLPESYFANNAAECSD